MKARQVLALGYVFAVITIGLAVGVLNAKSTGGFNPSVSNLGPSGTHAFERLLRESGVDVVVDTDVRPVLGKNDLGLMFDWVSRWDEGFIDEPRMGNLDVPRLDRLIHGGATVIRAHFGSGLKNDFDPPGPMMVGRVRERGGTPLKPKFSISAGNPGDSSAPTGDSVTYFSGEGRRTFVSLQPIGAGYYVNVDDGLGMTNRLLDQNDNARFYVHLVKSFLKPGGRVVILEASAGPGTELSLMANVGPWAEAAWRQAQILFLIILVTLGFTFGNRIRESVPTPGTRDLLTAFGFLMERAKKPNLAASLLEKEARNRIRALRNRDSSKTKTLEILLEDAVGESKEPVGRWNEVFMELQEQEKRSTRRTSSVTESSR